MIFAIESNCDSANHVLPLLWSLKFALTEKQWDNFRERIKRMSQDWNKCSCPKRCKANTLDENWKYDHAQHIKSFIDARFICRGCHWLKSPGARRKTWLKPVPPMTKPPHIIDCLGWTQERIDRLREHDLREHEFQEASFAEIQTRVRIGDAVTLEKPIENLSTDEVERLIKPGQTAVTPWRIDLSRVSLYGYTGEDIQLFEQRMYNLAAKRMKTAKVIVPLTALGHRI